MRGAARETTGGRRQTGITTRVFAEHERLQGQARAIAGSASTSPVPADSGERREWVAAAGTRASRGDGAREPAFTPATPPAASFKPLVPRMWVARNTVPTKDEICRNEELYQDCLQRRGRGTHG